MNQREEVIKVMLEFYYDMLNNRLDEEKWKQFREVYSAGHDNEGWDEDHACACCMTCFLQFMT